MRTTLAQLGNNWCVYELKHNDTLIYIGACPLSRIYTLPDAREVGEFVRMVGADDPIEIQIVYNGQRMECYNMRGKMLREIANYPAINLKMYTKSQMIIVCNEDGKEYRTQAEVCNAYGIGQGNLSNHLAQKPGFTRLKGLTFARKLKEKS